MSISGPSSSFSHSSLSQTENAAWQLLNKAVSQMYAEGHEEVKQTDLIDKINTLSGPNISSALQEKTITLANELFLQAAPTDNDGASTSNPSLSISALTIAGGTLDIYTLSQTVENRFQQEAAFHQQGPADLALQHALLLQLDAPIEAGGNLVTIWTDIDSDGTHRKQAEELLKNSPADLERFQQLIEQLPSLSPNSLKYQCFDVFNSLWALPNVDRSESLRLLLADAAGFSETTLLNLIDHYTDALIGKAGSMSTAIASVLHTDDKTFEKLNMPTTEDIRTVKSRYAKDWQALTDKIKNNAYSGIFLNNSTHARAYFYYQSLQKLHLVWSLTAETQPWTLLDEIPVFMPYCETGWNERIMGLLGQLQAFAKGDNIFDQPLTQACCSRRGAMEVALLKAGSANVHFSSAAKALLNTELALGYRPDELHPETEDILAIVRRLYVKSTRQAVEDLDPQDCINSTRSLIRASGEFGRKVVIQNLIERYRNSFNGEALILSDENVQRLQADSDSLRQWLIDTADLEGDELTRAWRSFKEGLFCDAAGVRYLLPDNTISNPNDFSEMAEWRSDLTAKLDHIIINADAHALAQLLEQADDLSELGIQLWLGTLGVVSYWEPEFNTLIHRLEPNATDLTVVRDKFMSTLQERLKRARDDLDALKLILPHWVRRDAAMMLELIANDIKTFIQHRWTCPVFELAEAELKADPAFISKVIEIESLSGDQLIDILEHCPPEIQSNPQLLMAAFTRFPYGQCAEQLTRWMPPAELQKPEIAGKIIELAAPLIPERIRELILLNSVEDNKKIAKHALINLKAHSFFHKQVLLDRDLTKTVVDQLIASGYDMRRNSGKIARALPLFREHELCVKPTLDELKNRSSYTCRDTCADGEPLLLSYWFRHNNAYPNGALTQEIEAMPNPNYLIEKYGPDVGCLIDFDNPRLTDPEFLPSLMTTKRWEFGQTSFSNFGILTYLVNYREEIGSERINALQTDQNFILSVASHPIPAGNAGLNTIVTIWDFIHSSLRNDIGFLARLLFQLKHHSQTLLSLITGDQPEYSEQLNWLAFTIKEAPVLPSNQATPVQIPIDTARDDKARILLALQLNPDAVVNGRLDDQARAIMQGMQRDHAAEVRSASEAGDELQEILHPHIAWASLNAEAEGSDNWNDHNSASRRQFDIVMNRLIALGVFSREEIYPAAEGAAEQ